MEKYNASLHWKIEYCEVDGYGELTGDWLLFEGLNNPGGLYFNQRKCYADFDILCSVLDTWNSARIVQVSAAILEYGPSVQVQG